MEKTFSVEDERKDLRNLASELAKSSNYDEFKSSTRDSSLKRVNTIIRKIRFLSLDSDSSPQLIKEIQQVNISMHFGEICSSILENRPKNSVEYLALVRIIIHLSIESYEFPQFFERELLKNISNLAQSGINPSDKNSYNSFRFFFRLACELQAVQAVDGQFNGICSIFEKLVSQEDEKAREFIPFAVYLVKNFKPYLPSVFAGNLLFEKLYESIVKFFKAMCRFSIRIFNQYKSLEAKCRFYYEQKGDLFSELEVDLLKIYEEFKTIQVSIKGFAELLNLPMPKFENSEPQFIIDDNKIIFTTKISIEADIYQDEDERSFYEDLPASATLNKDESFLMPEEWTTSDEIEEIYKEEVNPETIGKLSIKERLPKGMEQFFKQVEGIISVSDVDNLSERINIAGKEFNIEKYYEMFFEIARKKNELVKYIARMLATIKHTHPTLIQSMIKSMCGQFHFLTVKKMPITGTRRRICTFISEFTKFKLLPQSIAFNCLKKCVKDFTGPNIDMTSYQLEQSGRFLYLQPQSHARMHHLITKIGNFRRNSFSIPNDKNILLGYALYCVIRTQTENFFIEPDFMETFFIFAFGRLESEDEFVDFFKSLQWSDENSIKILQNLLIQVSGLEVGNFDNFVQSLRLLNESPSSSASIKDFIYKIVDLIICESISDFKRFDSFNVQHALKRVQLIGRFFYRGIISTETFFGYLYQLITLGHNTKDSAQNENSFIDIPTNNSRIRSILTLLNSLKDLRFLPEFYSLMTEFLAMFRCYLCSKTEITKELFELAGDVYKAFDDAPLEPLNFNICRMEFLNYRVSSLFIEQLTYLSDEEYKNNFTTNKISEDNSKKSSQINELDLEMSRIIGQELESRKLDRLKPQNSDVYLPVSGLMYRQGGGTSSSNGSGPTSPSILLKKKKKFVIKSLTLPDKK